MTTRCARIALGLGAAGLFAGTAAEPYYFYKAAVSRDTYMADIDECNELAGGVRVGRAYTYSPNIHAVAAGAFFSGLMQGAERRRFQDKVQQTCMADKGYRRLTIDKVSVQAIKAMQDKERLDRLFDLAAAPTPLGKELPE